MRKSAAVLFILASISALTAGVLPEAASGHKSPSSSPFALAVSPGLPGFSLAGSSGPSSQIGAPNLDLLQDPGDLAIAEKRPEVPAPVLNDESAVPRLSFSIFIGPKGNDVFASLHKAYAWKPMSRTLTVGLGLFREIPIYRGIGLLPYVGIIRASATLSLAGPSGNRESIEYRLTAFCVGLPLVIRFN